MTLTLAFYFFCIIFFPAAWLVSEFRDKRWMRILFGVLTILTCFGIASLVVTIKTHNTGERYGVLTRTLVGQIINELELENKENVLSELKQFRDNYNPENADYEAHVSETIKKINSNPQAVKHAGVN